MYVVIDSDDNSEDASSTHCNIEPADFKSPEELLGLNETGLAEELSSIDAEMARLRRRRQVVASRLAKLRRQAEAAAQAARKAEQGKQHAEARQRYSTLEKFPWTDKVRHVLRHVFGHTAFRGVQEAAINATMDRRDCVVVMPTGGGKSLCYQVPALASAGLTLVVSPLIALMDDQVLQLRASGVDAEAFTSESRNAVEVRAKLRALTETNGGTRKRRRCVSGSADDEGCADDTQGLRILYVAPEKLISSKQFVKLLSHVHAAGRLARIVVDECHCASEYGSDFRPDYGRLGMLRLMFPDVPLLALSATCPPRVLSNVIHTLGIDPLVFTAPLWRPNLRFSVKRKAEGAQGVAEAAAWVCDSTARGIVYCATRSDAHDIADALLTAGVAVGLYYGALDRTHKQALHADWRSGRLRVVVATNAFGMGIDAPDVGFVLHVTAPKTLEAYYQEAGRAGRDGRLADCVLMYRSADSAKLVGWGFDTQGNDGVARARAVVRYVETLTVCRKRQLLAHLQSDEDASACGVCDVCVRDSTGGQGSGCEIVSVDCTALAVSLINITRCEERMTLARLIKHARAAAGRSAPAVTPLVKDGRVRTVQLMAVEDLAHIVNALADRSVLIDAFVQTAYTTNAYIDVASEYEYVVGCTIDDALSFGFGPVVLDYRLADLPAGLEFSE